MKLRQNNEVKMIKSQVKLNIPNLISLSRLLSVPFAVWLIINDELLICFWILVYAGVSDAVDGFISKRYNLSSKLGGYLDPIADKALLISVFISLGYTGYLYSWLILIVVFRDILILLGALIYHLMYQDLVIEPLVISKINTTVQFILLAVIIGFNGFNFKGSVFIDVLIYTTAFTTLSSGAAYVYTWGGKVARKETGD